MPFCAALDDRIDLASEQTTKSPVISRLSISVGLKFRAVATPWKVETVMPESLIASAWIRRLKNSTVDLSGVPENLFNLLLVESEFGGRLGMRGRRLDQGSC